MEARLAGWTSGGAELACLVSAEHPSLLSSWFRDRSGFGGQIPLRSSRMAASSALSDCSVDTWTASLHPIG